MSRAIYSRAAGALFISSLCLLYANAASASAPTLFGPGARSAGLARADVSSADPADAPLENAALAAEPGLRLRLGYGYASMGGLSIDDQSAGVSDASGFDLAAQLGLAVSTSVTLGLALSTHLPDTWLARLSFRPATEPQFVLYEASLQRTTFDLVAAIRYRSLSIGGGVSLGVGVGGGGTEFDLNQDAAGTRADAMADVALSYRAAPIAGVRLGLGRLSLGASFRGSSAIDLRLESKVGIALTDNPLNGITTVSVRGVSGYDPAALDFGASFAIGAGLTAHGALELALYGSSPPPVADVTIDMRLGTIPSQREARFIEPRFRSTLSPRIALELRRPSGPAPAPVSESATGSEPAFDAAPASARAPASGPDPIWRWALRAGYVLAPSPVPKQTGFTTYADAARHGISLGGGYHFGRLLGVDVSANLAAEIHILANRHEEKPNPSLPYSRYDVGGHILYGSATLEAVWR